MRHYLTVFFITSLTLLYIKASAQTSWFSNQYGYSIEIPSGFKQTTAIGNNIDFKATKGSSSVVVSVQKLPQELSGYTFWEMMGDLSTYGADWEQGAQEYMNNPRFLKYGKSTIDKVECFWYDYTTDNPELYSKTYQFLSEGLMFTVTLTCEKEQYNNYSAIWLRFKNNFKLN
jgi:hypothetical protein